MFIFQQICIAENGKPVYSWNHNTRSDNSFSLLFLSLDVRFGSKYVSVPSKPISSDFACTNQTNIRVVKENFAAESKTRSTYYIFIMEKRILLGYRNLFAFSYFVKLTTGEKSAKWMSWQVKFSEKSSVLISKFFQLNFFFFLKPFGNDFEFSLHQFWIFLTFMILFQCILLKRLLWSSCLACFSLIKLDSSLCDSFFIFRLRWKTIVFKINFSSTTVVVNDSLTSTVGCSSSCETRFLLYFGSSFLLELKKIHLLVTSNFTIWHYTFPVVGSSSITSPFGIIFVCPYYSVFFSSYLASFQKL